LYNGSNPETNTRHSLKSMCHEVGMNVDKIRSSYFTEINLYDNQSAMIFPWASHICNLY